MNVFQFFIICKKTNNANKATHYVKLGTKRQESSKRNYYIISPGVITKAIIIIGTNWFLDQEIQAGGFVRIQDSLQVWEERVDETRIITTEGLTTCLDPGDDDDCFYYHSWRNNVVNAFGPLSSFLT